MVSDDVEKFRKIVQTLETEASNMQAFNGVLNSLSETNKEIMTAKRELSAQATEQRRFISKTEEKFDSYSKKIAGLEGSVLQLREEALYKSDFTKANKAKEKRLATLIDEYRQETERLLEAKGRNIMLMNAIMALLYIFTTALIVYRT